MRSDGLFWCLKTFFQPGMFAWHAAELFLRGFLLFCLLRGATFAVFSILRTLIFLRAMRRAGAPAPARLIVAATRAGLPVSDLIYTQNSQAQLFCIGLWSPKIIVSAGLLDSLTERELTTSLRHEELHRRKHHGAVLLLTEVAREIFWFLPVGAEVVAYLRHRSEVSADRWAADKDGKTHLCQALKKLLSSPAPQWSLPLAGSPATARVESLLTGQTQPLRFSLATVWRSLGTAGLLVVITFALAAPRWLYPTSPAISIASAEHANHCAQPILFTPR